MTVDTLLDNTYGNFVSNSVDFFFENGENFIYEERSVDIPIKYILYLFSDNSIKIESEQSKDELIINTNLLVAEFIITSPKIIESPV